MKNWFKLLLFIVITFSILVGLNKFVFVDKVIDTAYGGFYSEKENSIDVISIGSSTVKEGIIGNEIWNNYGVTSYSINSAPTHPEVIKIIIDEIARTQSPKVVYVDLMGLTYHLRENQKTFVREYVNSMPDGKEKEELIKKYSYLKDDDEELEIFDGHNNFRNPNYLSAVFLNSSHEFKGYTPIYTKISQKVDNTIDYSKTISLPKDGKEYLIEILETCKKYPHINFLFGMMPKFINSSDAYEVHMLNSAIPTIESYGYKYINWAKYTKEIGLDPSFDMRDSQHLNVYGAIKFTDYFAKYLDKNYGIVGNTYSDDVVKDFDECYKTYEKRVLKKVKRKTKNKDLYNRSK